MNKFCQRVITISVVVMAIFSVLSYLKIKDLDSRATYNDIPSMPDKQLEYIQSDIRDIKHNIWLINDSTSKYFSSQKNVSYYLENIYDYIVEINQKLN